MTAFAEDESRRSRCARVLAVDDRSPFRDVLCELIRAAPSLELLAAADSGESAVDVATSLEPDMVIMDVVMPGLGGIAAARRIKATAPETVVVLVSTTHPDDLACEVADGLVDAVVWKAHLRPQLLEELWFSHRRGSGTGISPPT
jgi:DNA-binding NarL/FixJ family response regulator